MKYVLLMLTTLLISSVSYSAVYQSICNSCQNERDFERVAYTYAGYFEEQRKIRRFSHSLYVYNYNLGLVQKFSIVGEGYGAVGEPGDTDIRSKPLTSFQTKQFERAYSNLKSYTDEIESEIVPDSVAQSAYDLVGASYKVNDLADYYKSSQSLSTYMSNFIAAAASITGKLPSGIKLTVTLKFSDHSTVVLEATGLDSEGNLNLKYLSGKDADNNTISERAASYLNGTYRFSKQGEAGIQRFLNAASRSGIQITYGKSNSNGVRLLGCIDGICKITTVATTE